MALNYVNIFFLISKVSFGFMALSSQINYAFHKTIQSDNANCGTVVPYRGIYLTVWAFTNYVGFFVLLVCVIITEMLQRFFLHIIKRTISMLEI